MEAGEIGVDIVGLRVTVKVGWSLPSIGRFGAPVMLGCNSFFILDSFKETLHCSFFLSEFVWYISSKIMQRTLN